RVAMSGGRGNGGGAPVVRGTGRHPAARESLATLIVERLADAVMIVDAAGIVQFANPAAERLFGRDAPHVAPLLGSAFGFPILLDEIAEVELVPPRPEGAGEPLLVELRAAEIPWEGAPAHVLSLRDVTERRRMEQRIAELERLRSDAEASNRAKADFLAMMSHELRTPLNAIMGYAQLLHLGIVAPLAEEQRAQVQRISNSARHLLSLVNDILDLTKIEAGRLTVTAGVGTLGDALNAALELVRPAAAAREVALDVNCGDPDQRFRGDESRVRQVLVNLLQNAVKFTPAGGTITASCGVARVAPTEARLPRVGPYAYFRVDDTGIGIPPARLAAIFDPFVRVESGHTRRTDGSGLGLSISRRLARLMDGDITVASEEERGSSFTLWLPCVDAASPDGRPCEAVAAEVPPAPGTATRAGPSTPGTGGRAVPADAARERLPDPTTLDAGVADVGQVLLRESGSIVASLVLRLRHEEQGSHLLSVQYPDLANHFVSFIAVLAETLMTRSEHGALQVKLVEEGLEMLRALADRHGTQRARLGFHEGAVEREWEMLQEEMDRVLAEHTTQLQPRAVSEALVLVRRNVLHAQMRSRRSFRQAARLQSAPEP
ncbi:MAG TPA: ATP-binding protein, partial [Gemmatimonadaceae bacterium]